MKSIADLLKAVITNKKEVVVGTVDLSFIEELEKIKSDGAKLHDEIKEEINAFVKKIKADRNPMLNVLERRQKDAFKKILIAAGIPESEHEKDYSINKNTGEITRIDSEIDPVLKEAFARGDNTFRTQ